MWQQFVDPAGRLRGQPLEDVTHVGARQPGLVRRLELMRHTHGALEQAAGEYLRGTDSLLGSKHTTVARLRAVQGQSRRVVGAIAA